MRVRELLRGIPLPGIVQHEARRALPYALLLAVGLGVVVTAGAQYSNAFPSEKAPFGWPGPASFENAVAMVRSDLVLAASLPALLLGARALAGREPAGGRKAEDPDAPEGASRTREDGRSFLLQVYGIHAALLALAVVLGGALGAWGAGRTLFEAWQAFVTAHVVLVLSFYSLAFLWSSLLKEHALAAAAATWLAFLAVYEAVTRTILFRSEGYHNLAGGAFPDWFWVAQGFSPLSSYTGILILWRPRFRDYMESAALDGAALPAWLVPATFIALAAVLWIALPLALSHVAWWRRGRAALRSAAVRATRA